MSPVDLSGVRRLVVVGDSAGNADLLFTAASREGIPVEVVSADDDPERLVASLVELVGDGRDTVIVGSGGASATAARRTGADLWTIAGEAGCYVVTPSAECRDDALDDLHAEEADPWGVETRWYERRKRDLILATLPRTTFERALELGCSTGALAEALATRSHRVVAVDQSATAVAAADRRFQDVDHVEVLAIDVPREWPGDGLFDLVVVSEVGYFMNPLGLEQLVTRVAGSLNPDGVVVLCHWRHPIEGWVLDGDDVHAGFQDPRLPPVAASYRDRDVEILVLAPEDTWPDPSQ